MSRELEIYKFRKKVRELRTDHIYTFDFFHDAVELAIQQVQEVYNRISTEKESPRASGMIFDLLIQIVPFGIVAKHLKLTNIFEDVFAKILGTRMILNLFVENPDQLWEKYEYVPESKLKSISAEMRKNFLNSKEILELYSVPFRQHVFSKTSDAIKNIPNFYDKVRELASKPGNKDQKSRDFQILSSQDTLLVSLKKSLYFSILKQKNLHLQLFDEFESYSEHPDCNIEIIKNINKGLDYLTATRTFMSAEVKRKFILSCEFYIWKMMLPDARFNIYKIPDNFVEKIRDKLLGPFKLIEAGIHDYNKVSKFIPLPIEFESYIFGRFRSDFEDFRPGLADEHLLVPLFNAWNTSTEEITSFIDPYNYKPKYFR